MVQTRCPAPPITGPSTTSMMTPVAPVIHNPLPILVDPLGVWLMAGHAALLPV
jgi:hypothetical protein